jgi:hypothetical protein
MFDFFYYVYLPQLKYTEQKKVSLAGIEPAISGLEGHTLPGNCTTMKHFCIHVALIDT